MAPQEVDKVWSRMLAGEPLRAEDFAAVARWAFLTMPVDQRRPALFDLFERCTSERPMH